MRLLSPLAVLLSSLALLGGCAVDAANDASESSAAIAAAPSNEVVALRARIDDGAVVEDTITTVSSRAIELDVETVSELGMTSVDRLVRTDVVVSDGERIEGVVFNFWGVGGAMGTHGGEGAHFSDSSRQLVLNAAGLRLVETTGVRTSVPEGPRRELLHEIFDRTPHPNAPDELKWGEHPFFAWSNGAEATVLLGHLYVRDPGGAIVQFSMAPELARP